MAKNVFAEDPLNLHTREVEEQADALRKRNARFSLPPIDGQPQNQPEAAPEGLTFEGYLGDEQQPEAPEGMQFDGYLEDEAPAESEEELERTWGEAFKDTAASFGIGAGSLLELGGTITGLFSGDMDGNWGTRLGESAREFYEGWKSDALLAKEEARQAKIDAAGSEAAKLWVTLTETATDPALGVSFAVQQIPNLVTSGLGGRAAYLATTKLGAKRLAARKVGKSKAESMALDQAAMKTAGKYGTAGGVATGAIMQGADVGGDSYMRLMDEDVARFAAQEAIAGLVSAGVPESEAKKQIALELSRLAALKSAAMSIGVQALIPGARSIERVLAGGSRSAGGGLKGAVSGSVRGTLGEAVSEGTEEGYGRVASNQAVQAFNPGQRTFEGAGQAVGEGALFGLFGTVTGAVEGAKRKVELPDSGPLSRAVNKSGALDEQAEESAQAEAEELAAMTMAAENQQRVTLRDETGEIAGTLVSHVQAADGTWQAKVLTDDGMLMDVTDADGIELLPQARADDPVAVDLPTEEAELTESLPLEGAPAGELEPAGDLQPQVSAATLDPGRPVLQNRDRSTPASITQMRSIASDPDYDRLGFSRDFASGAPVIEPGADIPAERMGRSDKVTSSRGRKIPVQYAVVESDQLLPSNDINGSANPAYEGGEPGRSRVIAGNGRAAGLQQANIAGTAAQYREALAGDADLHGIDPTVIDGMKNPVLVRVMPQEDVTADIGDESNVSGLSELSPAEQAKNDARRIQLTDLEFSEDGRITPTAVRQFVQAMPESERGALLDRDQPSKRAYDRMENAIFATAYESDALIRLQAQAVDPEARTVLSALLMVAPRMARLKGTGDLDIRDLVVEAAEAAVNARRRGEKLSSFIDQMDMTASPELREFVVLMADNIRSAKRMAGELENIANAFYAEASLPSEDMFGAVQKRDRSQLLKELTDGNREDTQAAGNQSRSEPDPPAEEGRGAETRSQEGSTGSGRQEIDAGQAVSQQEESDPLNPDTTESPDSELRRPAESTQELKASDVFKVGDLESKGATSNIYDYLKDPDYFRSKKGIATEVVQMSPDEYVRRAAKTLSQNEGREITPKELADQRLESQDRDGGTIVDGMVKAMRQGTQFAAPYLSPGGQEGLHRALAAKQLGMKSIPVVIVSNVPKASEQKPAIDSVESKPVVAKSGKPFKSKGVAISSAKRSGVKTPKVVPVGDGFGYVADGQATAESSARVKSEAPEHAAVGVDDRDLSEIVSTFNEAQAASIEDGDKVTHVFDAPAKSEIVRLQNKVKVHHAEHGWMTPAEAKKRIQEWKDHADSQYEDANIRSANSRRVVLSLFDLSGKWAQPWADAGYDVYRFDIQDEWFYDDNGVERNAGDIHNFTVEFFADMFGDFQGNEVHAILAACPCTDFAVSGARHFAAKDSDGRTVASVKLVHQTMATIEYFKPAVWAIENPVGRIEKLGGLPPWRLSFDPNHLGEDYTKKTLIWGRFNADLPIAPTEPTEGSKMHKKYGGKSLATKNARSATPEGFAYSFFMANNAHDNPVLAIHGKYDRLDRGLIEQAVEAGITEEQISDAVDDFYYMDLDDDAANDAIRELIAGAGEGGFDLDTQTESDLQDKAERDSGTDAETRAQVDRERDYFTLDSQTQDNAPDPVKSTGDLFRETSGNYSTRKAGQVLDKVFGGDGVSEGQAIYAANVSGLDRSIDRFKMGDAERAAFLEFMNGRQDAPDILSRLDRLHDTPWAKQAIMGALSRQAMTDMLAGREVKYDSPLNRKGGDKLRRAIEKRGEEGLWDYLAATTFIGNPEKPVNAVNGSFLDCNPSKSCAKFCYATKGHYNYATSINKAELITWAVENNPARAGKMIARQYKSMSEFEAQKALRLFDKGDISAAWLPVIKELNRQGVRVQIFSKRPEILRQVSDKNVRMLSIDESNLEMAAGNQDLMVALVYDGSEKLTKWALDNADNLSVILPIKIGRRTLSDAEIAPLKDNIKTRRRLCPIDSGFKKLGEWNCTKCDKDGGIACFYGSSTATLNAVLADIDVADPDTQKLVEELRNVSEQLDGPKRSELLDQLDQLLSVYRTEPDPETARTDPEAFYSAAEGSSRRGRKDQVSEPEAGSVQSGQRGASDAPAAPNLNDSDQLDLFSERTNAATKFFARAALQQTGEIKAGIDRVSSPEDAAHILSPFRKKAQENMVALVLDADGKVLSIVHHTKGGNSSASVFSGELAGAIAATPGAAKVYLAHNHPSGTRDSSGADKKITDKIKGTLEPSGIMVEGHVILSEGQTATYFYDGASSDRAVRVKPMVRRRTIPITEKVIRTRSKVEAISSAASAKQYADEIGEGIILLSNAHAPVAYLPMTADQMSSLKGEGYRRILETINNTNAAAAIIAVPDGRSESSRNAGRALDNAELRVLDAFEGGKSQAEKGLNHFQQSGMFFSRSSRVATGATPRGVSKGAVNVEVGRFLKQYKGADDVTVKVFRTYEEAHGKKPDFKTKGGYEPKTDTLYLYTEAFDSVADVRETLQHEILVHKGLGHFDPKLLQSFLGSVRAAAKESPQLAEIMDEVERVEKGRSEALQSEEVLARIAEKRLSLPNRAWNKLMLALQRLLRSMGIRVEVSAQRQAREFIYKIGDAFAEGKRAPRRNTAGILNQSVYHGTPHNFDLFSLAAVGSGEGAQAYGWGLYFAGKREVAEYYRDALSRDLYGSVYRGKEKVGGAPSKAAVAGKNETVQSIYDEIGGDIGSDALWVKHAIKRILIARREDAKVDPRAIAKKIMGEFSPMLGQMADLVSTVDAAMADYVVRPGGNLYQANVPEDSELLDYDKPLSEQPEAVREALEEMDIPDLSLAKAQRRLEGRDGIFQQDEAYDFEYDEDEGGYVAIDPNGEHHRDSGGGIMVWQSLAKARKEMLDQFADDAERGAFGPTDTGQDIYEALKITLGSDQAASHALNEAGIPGLRFLDDYSRGDMRAVKFRANELSMRRNIDAYTSEEKAALYLGIYGRDRADEMLRMDDYIDAAAALERITEGDIEVVDRSTRNYVIWDETRVSVEAVNEQIDAAEEMFFSRSDVEEKFDDLDGDQKSFMGKIGPQSLPRQLKDRWRQLTDSLALRVRQAGVDRYAALLRNDKALLGEDTLEGSIADSSWVLARMSNAAGGALSAMMGTGRIFYDGKSKLIDVKEGTQGLADTLKKLGSPAEIDRFMGWVAANRARKLSEEGRENLFTPEEIAAGMKLNTGETETGKRRPMLYATVWKEFQQHRDDVLGIADATGLLRKGMEEQDALMFLAKENGINPELAKRLRGAQSNLDRAEDGDEQDERQALVGRLYAQLYDEVATAVESFESDMERLQTDQRDLWAEEFYVPFYRVLDEDNIGGPTGSGGLSRQQAYKRLKGGSQNLNDLLENTLLNFHHLLQASLKNRAAAQAVENAEALGIATPVSEAERNKKTSTWVLIDGAKAWYDIDDPLTFKAVSMLQDAGYNNPAMKIGRAFKRFFTQMTTITPQFVVANAIRDTLSALATSPAGANPAANIAKGTMTYMNNYKRGRMLASGGAFSFGHVYGTSPEDIKKSLSGDLGRMNIREGAEVVPKLIVTAWRKWGDATSVAENINRAAIWERNVGEDKLKAAFEARDLMDFSAQGDAVLIRILADLVPFMNARLQGLDKLYRSGVRTGAKTVAGKASKAERQAFARFATVTAALSLVSMMLYLRAKDDEEYRALEDWQRDTYWPIRIGDSMIFIPKPFEVGAIATMSERLLEQFVDPTAGGDKFAERLAHALGETFAMNPIPQALMPIAEISTNRDFFTDRPIENMGMQRLSPSLRSRPNTSGFSETVSSGLEAAFGTDSVLTLSPVQLDHLITGYIGQVGTYAFTSADTLWRTAQGRENAARRWYEYQPLRRFYRKLTDEVGYTRYSTMFYDTLRESNRLYSDVRHLQQIGEAERAQALVKEGGDKLAMRKALNRAQRRLSGINKRIRDVRLDSEMDGETKRQEIDRLMSMKNLITKRIGVELEQRKAAQ
ncbi:LPD38 domain-containing protein [Zhongshania sp.]|uniref:LPD38 domain-containing protein n=1 Tax=Zhongshania sp. TaxID=1971902 RepID=UPI003568C7F7